MAVKGKGGNTVARVTELVLPIVEELGLILWDVVFEKEGISWYLRIVIDFDGGVTFDHCEAVSRKLDKMLDEKDFIEQAYILEVSSAGIGRKLTKKHHFEAVMGKKIRIRLIRPLNGLKELTGLLQEFDGETIILNQPEGEVISISKADCAFIKLYDDEFLGGFTGNE